MALLAGLQMGCDAPPPEASSAIPKENQVAEGQLAGLEFAGSETCKSCHAEEFAQWQTSHHAQAMQMADPTTVLATFPYQHAEVTLTATADTFTVTEQATGSFPITHTFGVAPLQQYLADTGQGRLQTLRETWDARPAESGGQRWFLQYPQEEIPPGDVLHWLGTAQNWNSMCADCHTTGFEKGYDPASSSFQSSFAEMGVSCESCHGPASAHLLDPAVKLPAHSALANPATQPDVCAPCHARREQVAEGYTAGAQLLDYYVPQLLNPPLYHADGQINDEVYVYASFVSSKMFNRGVTCNDCHEPHSAALRVPGDGVCLQCHTPAGNPRFTTLTLKTDYTARDHHGHEPGSEGASCIGCHMPSKIYMGIDERHDHSLRVPDLKLAASHGTPTPCARCHETPPLMATPRSDHFGRLFTQSPITAEGALSRLAADEQQNTIVRASALAKINQPRTAGALRSIEGAAKDADALMRHTSLVGIAHITPGRRLATLKRLLADPVRAVRIRAASIALTEFELSERQSLQPEFGAARDEYIAANQLHAERPSANVNLASAYLSEGDEPKAQAHLERALALNDSFVPALLNYADLLRQQSREAQAQEYLLKAVNLDVVSPTADYAYAMWLVRNGSRELALPHLKRAYESDPQTLQWIYAYSIALHSLGQSSSALQLLRSLKTKPVYTEELMYLHASIARDNDLLDEARLILDDLLTRAPSNTTYQALAESLN